LKSRNGNRKTRATSRPPEQPQTLAATSAASQTILRFFVL
jgi:hypothetical protein